MGLLMVSFWKENMEKERLRKKKKGREGKDE